MLTSLADQFGWENVNVLYEYSEYADDLASYFKQYFRNCTTSPQGEICNNRISTIQVLQADANTEVRGRFVGEILLD